MSPIALFKRAEQTGRTSSVRFSLFRERSKRGTLWPAAPRTGCYGLWPPPRAFGFTAKTLGNWGPLGDGKEAWSGGTHQLPPRWSPSTLIVTCRLGARVWRAYRQGVEERKRTIRGPQAPGGGQRRRLAVLLLAASGHAQGSRQRDTHQQTSQGEAATGPHLPRSL